MKSAAKKPINDVLASHQRVGQYSIVRKLSNGGFGVVYLAQRDDGQLVALKEFLPSMLACRPLGGGPTIQCASEHDYVRFQEGLKAFFREADMLAQVHSTRIIPVWDVFKDHGTAYFAMPLEKGGTLQSLVRLQSNPLSERELRSIAVEACKGVEALHAKGLLHLDIKPNNLWVRPDRSVLVLDLGASRWEDEEMQNSQMARTPGFAAPEQHSHIPNKNSPPRLSVSARTDVYGLCATVLSCLTQGPPPAAPLRRAADPVITWPLIGHTSSELLRVVNKGMSLVAEFRHANVAELRRDLERLPRLSYGPRWPEALSYAPWPDPPSSVPSCHQDSEMSDGDTFGDSFSEHSTTTQSSSPNLPPM